MIFLKCTCCKALFPKASNSIKDLSLIVLIFNLGWIKLKLSVSENAFATKFSFKLSLSPLPMIVPLLIESSFHCAKGT